MLGKREQNKVGKRKTHHGFFYFLCMIAQPIGEEALMKGILSEAGGDEEGSRGEDRRIN